MKAGKFFDKLADFVKRQVTETVIDQDINTLLSIEKFREVRKVLKVEVLRFLEEEKMRLKRLILV